MCVLSMGVGGSGCDREEVEEEEEEEEEEEDWVPLREAETIRRSLTLAVLGTPLVH